VSLYLSKSVSSILSLAGVLGVLFAAAFVGSIPRSFRTITLVFCSLFVLGIGFIGAAYDVHEVVLKHFGKNTTLTGRTYLWGEAMKEGMKAPLFGHGYSAFWVEGQPKAEYLWMKFGVKAKIGFHFHNVYFETFVELGMLGVAIIAYLMLANCWRSTRMILRYGLSVDNMYALGVSVLLFIRAMVEVDVIGTFSIGPLLFYSVIPRLAVVKRAKQEASGQNHITDRVSHPFITAPPPQRPASTGARRD
jgi:exopolysaccharide production protein ExoQ